MKRIEFLTYLELVKSALSDTDIVPIFTHFMCREGEVSASNDDLTIIAKSKSIDTDDLVFAVNGKNLLGLLNSSGGDELEVGASGSYDVTFKVGNSLFTLPFLPEEDFLFKEPTAKWAVSLKVDESVIEGIEICLTTSSKDNTTPAINGVCFNFGDPVVLYSCDGDAITQYNLKQAKEGDAFTIPTRFCEAVLKICKEGTASGIIEINKAWAKASLRDGEFVIYGRLLSNDNPLDHSDWIKKTMTGKAPFVSVPKELSAALTRARVLADQESKQTVFAISDDTLYLTTETSAGIVEDEIEFKHPSVKASAHAELVQRSIEICDEISIRENCTCYRWGSTVLQVVSNIGE